jgi:tRNA threonylcarbamoyladenosine biosynthesis protein TsaB
MHVPPEHNLNVLAIETSSEIGSVCVSACGQIFIEASPVDAKLSAWVVAAVERVLSLAAITLSQLDLVAYGAGPGAFTGVRTACATVQAIAYAHDLPLIAVDSMHAMAALCEQNGPNDADITVLLDARMNQLYVADFFRNSAGPATRVSDTQLVNTCDYEPKTLHAIFVGSGVVAWKNETEPLFVNTVIDRTRAIESRWAEGVALVATNLQRRHLSGENPVSPLVNPIDAQPIYVRNQVAQTEIERAQLRTQV